MTSLPKVTVRRLALLFLIALVIRGTLGLVLVDTFPPVIEEYTKIAWNLLDGNGYSMDGATATAYRTPGYPLYLVGVGLVSGRSLWGFVAGQAVVGAVAAVLCFALARRLFDSKTAYVAFIIYAALPYLAWMELTTEGGLVAAGLMSSSLAVLWFRAKPGLGRAALVGGMLALTYLVRPTIVTVVPLLLLAMFIPIATARVSIKRGHIAQLLGLAVLVFALPILVWGLRNNAALGTFELSQTNMWQNIWKGSHERTWEIYPQASLDNLLGPQVNEVELEDWFRDEAIPNLQERGLVGNTYDTLRKLRYLYDVRIVPRMKRVEIASGTIDVARPIVEEAMFTASYAVLLALGAVGLIMGIRRRPRLVIIGTIALLLFSLPYVITFSYSRFTTQIYFGFIIAAALGAVILWNSVGSTFRDRFEPTSLAG